MSKKEKMTKYENLSFDTNIDINLLPACEDCWGRCCHYMTINITLGKDMAELLSVHYDRKITKLSVRIDHKCKELDEDNLCKLFGSPDRPNVCDKWICPERIQPHVLYVQQDGLRFGQGRERPKYDEGLALNMGGQVEIKKLSE